MKILMTADTIGGVWTYALDLARALPEFEFHIATMGAPLADDQWRAAEAIRNVRIHDSVYRLEWMPDPWEDVRAAGEWLLELERRIEPDIVHSNGYAHAALPFRAPVLVGGHSCVLSWWDAVKGEPAPPEWRHYAEVVGHGIRAADRIVTPTYAMRASLVRHYGPMPKATVVPNGRDPERFRACAKHPFFLAAGRLWDEAKNIGALDRVAPHVDWPIRVAGAGESGENLRHLGRLGPREMATQFAHAAVYVLPALYEPFGLSVLEAALSGCALVLGDIPSLRENWEGAAVFVPPADTARLAADLNALAGDAERRATLAARARERATYFTLERMAAGYRALYRDLRKRGNSA